MFQDVSTKIKKSAFAIAVIYAVLGVFMIISGIVTIAGRPSHVYSSYYDMTIEIYNSISSVYTSIGTTAIICGISIAGIILSWIIYAYGTNTEHLQKTAESVNGFSDTAADIHEIAKAVSKRENDKLKRPDSESNSNSDLETAGDDQHESENANS